MNRRGRTAALVAAAVLIAWPPAGAADDFAAQAALFRYDAAADLDMQEVGIEKEGAVSVHDIRFTPCPVRIR